MLLPLNFLLVFIITYLEQAISPKTQFYNLPLILYRLACFNVEKLNIRNHLRDERLSYQIWSQFLVPCTEASL